MAKNFNPRYLIALYFQIVCCGALVSDSNFSFSFEDFGKDSNFESQLALYGDAKIVNDGSSLQITGSSVSSAGKVICEKPIKLVNGNPRNMVSFSSHFSFSLSAERGDGLAFVLVPYGISVDISGGGSFGLLVKRKMKFLAVEFDTLMDEKYGDMNDNHVGIDVGSLVSVKASNVSSVNLVVNSGEKLQVWIDYQAGSKRLEVRMGKLGEVRPLDPLLSCPIDLALLWKEEEVIVGLSSSSGNSSQRCDVYSWSLSTRTAPHWMHSEPLNPHAFEEKINHPNVNKKSDCAWRILAALIMGTCLGALGTFVGLLLWNIYGNRRPVMPVPEVLTIHPGQYEYKKFNLVVDKAIGDCKK